MRLLFWISLALIAYTYAGYPSLLWLLWRAGRRRPIDRQPITPTVSILIAARNEEQHLARKLRMLDALDYPKSLLQTIIISDGSTDRTAELLRAATPAITPVLLEHSVGKAAALNYGVLHATGSMLVFLDMRQSLPADAVRELMSCLADPQIGAVSGELHLETVDGLPSPDGLGMYWKIEKATRKLESATGSVVGVTGAIYAMRRNLYRSLPAGTLLDDVWVPMQVIRQGKRVVFHPGAVVRDQIFADPVKEFRRKVRTLTGNYQLLQRAPWLLSPSNPLLFRLISHKLLRLIVPLLLVLLLMASALSHGLLYRGSLLAQIGFYALALVGWVQPRSRRRRAVSIAYTFSMLNAAAALAFYNFLGRRTRWS